MVVAIVVLKRNEDHARCDRSRRRATVHASFSIQLSNLVQATNLFGFSSSVCVFVSVLVFFIFSSNMSLSVVCLCINV